MTIDEKAPYEMLVKLTTGVNLINILHEIYILAFFNFWQKNIGAKAPLKMLLKLTTGGNGSHLQLPHQHRPPFFPRLPDDFSLRHNGQACFNQV